MDYFPFGYSAYIRCSSYCFCVVIYSYYTFLKYARNPLRKVFGLPLVQGSIQ